MAATECLLSVIARETARNHNRAQTSMMVLTGSEPHVQYNDRACVKNINSLPREILHMIFETFNAHQGKRRGKLSLVVQQYIRDPCSVSFEKGFEADRTAMFRCLGVCKLWRDIVVDVLFVRSSRFWTYPEKIRKYLGIMDFVKVAECFRPPELRFILPEGDMHKRCRWQDMCACKLVMDISQCPYRDND